MWIGSEEGVLIRYQAGQFTSYTARDGLPPDSIVRIEEDDAGGLWLIGYRNYLIEYRENRFIAHCPADYFPGVVLPSGRRNNLWWSQDEHNLHVFIRGRRLSLTMQGGLPGLPVENIYVDQAGTLWLGTRGGAARVKNGQVTALPPHKYLPLGCVNCAVYEDRQGNLWYFRNQQLNSLHDGVITAHSEVHNFTFILYEDREGSVWFGSNEGLYRARALPVRTLTEAPRDYGLTKSIYSVLEDRSGNVWLGKLGGGLSCYRAGGFTHYVIGEEWRRMFWEKPAWQLRQFVYAEGLFSTKITSLYEDRAGVIWVGTEGGVSRFADGKFTRYSDQHGLAATWAMLQDQAGDFWFATTTGLARQHDGSFTIYTTKDGLPDDECHALLEDRHGRLWVGTYGGLARWEQGRFSAWTERDKLAGKQIRSLYEDAQGRLWIGTYDGGLTSFKEGRLKRVIQEPQGRKDNQERLGHRDLQASKDPLAQPVLQAPPGLKGRLGHKDQQGRRGRREHRQIYRH